MAKAIMMVFTDPVEPSREQEYREWYDADIAEALKAAQGMPRAVRYKLAKEQGHPVDVEFGFVTIYEIEADDVNAVHARLLDAWNKGELSSSDVARQGPIIYWDVDSEIT